MKIIIAECRPINRYASAFDKQWKFFAAFANQELADNYIKSVTKPSDINTIGGVFYGQIEFQTTEQDVYGWDGL